MGTTRSDIKGWLDEGARQGASHVIVACDTFDHSDYPVYIPLGNNPRAYPLGSMQKAMECYDLSLPIEGQLAEPRANHWDYEETPVKDEFEMIQAEAKAKEQEEFYETLEDNIMQLRSDVRAQADLLRAMDLAMLNPFLSNVMKLETLQRKYDEWEEDDA